MVIVYKCGHCGYSGPCYGVPTGEGVSAPFCKQCGMNNRLEPIEPQQAPPQDKPITLTPKQLEDLRNVLNYIFEHEAEDYVERLKEDFPEDSDYIDECKQEDNWESLDKYAWNGTREVQHIYVCATRVFKALKDQGMGG